MVLTRVPAIVFYKLNLSAFQVWHWVAIAT